MARVQHDDTFSTVCGRRIGMRRWDESQTVDNGAIAQKLVDQWGKASPTFTDFTGATSNLSRLSLNMPGGYYRDASGVTLPRKNGGCFEGQGAEADTHGYDGAPVVDLNNTRWGFDSGGNSLASDFAVWDIASRGTRLQNMVIQGYHAALQAAIWAADPSLFAPIGVLVRTDPDAWGGGLHGQHLGIAACDVCLQLGEVDQPTGNHADALRYDALNFSVARVGLLSNTIQSVNNKVGRIDAAGVETAVWAKLGGDWNIGTIQAGAGGGPYSETACMLKIGDSTGPNYEANADQFVVGAINIDQSLGDAKIVECVGPGFGCIHVKACKNPTGNTKAHRIIARSGWNILLDGCASLGESSVKFDNADDASVTPGVTRKVRLGSGVLLDPGVDPTKLVSSGSGILQLCGCSMRGNGDWDDSNPLFDASDQFEHDWPTVWLEQKWVNGVCVDWRRLSA